MQAPRTNPAELRQMSLGEKQELFSLMLAHLILYAYEHGYAIRMGEVLRMSAQAAANAKSGAGISNSLHTQKLAADLNLFKNGKWLQNSEDHRELGIYWESLGGSWGGRFSKPDGNHYSLEHNGVR